MTDDSQARLYTQMEERLAVVRRRLARPLTLADKLLLGHLDDPERQELRRGLSYLSLRPDRVVFQDVLGQTGLLQFMQTGRQQVAVPATIHCDHLIQARNEAGSDLRDALGEHEEVYEFLRSAASRFGLGFWPPGSGIVHQVVLENYAFPGQLIIGTDSHTPNAGGLGACAVGVGGADAVEVLAGLPWELLYPRAIGVHLTGRLDGWSAPKDVILDLAARLGVSGATNAVIEYLGPGARTLSATGKATITNMGAELGATTSLFPVDDHMLRYLRATGRGIENIEPHRHLFAADEEVEADPLAHYDRLLEIDLSQLKPHLAGPHSPDRLYQEGDFPDEISTALIGSCTNSSYEDLSRAAEVAAQAHAHGLRAKMPFYVTPGSERIFATTERDGQLQALRDIGAVVLANACGPCIGQWRREVSGPNSILSSFNRNFRGRNDGHADTFSFLASPEMVTALAIAGRLSFNPLSDELLGADGKPFRFRAPRAVDFPALAQTRGCIEPSGGEIVLRKNSQRIQPLPRWPAPDLTVTGKDFSSLLVLMKTLGKTTTDQISPAGPWLSLRGHLDRFSDNLLYGAVNAFTGETGLVTLDGSRVRPAAAARHHRAQGTRWVIVGDENYGEGSSREHAALSPRLLGCAAVIARSFARIHESNLKKQGLLALTFVDSADWQRIGERDRLSLLDFASLAPGRKVECLITHSDGSSETIPLRHSYSASQLEWFRRGSALNAAV